MRFSVVTITKNNPDGLARTEKSLKDQIFIDYDWIIIDGDKDPDNGIYDAMNKGIKRSKGDYVIFMNAGDIFSAPDILDIIAKYDADFIYGNSLGKQSKHYSRLPYGMITHHQAMVYRRDILKHLSYDERYPIAADYKLTLQFINLSYCILYINKVFCVFESGGVSEKNAKQGRMEQIQIRQELGIKAPFTPYRQWCGQIIKTSLTYFRMLRYNIKK